MSYSKKSSKPTLYHDLAKHLPKDYPDYNYDFFSQRGGGSSKGGKSRSSTYCRKALFPNKKDINRGFRLYSSRGSGYLKKCSAADATPKTTRKTR